MVHTLQMKGRWESSINVWFPFMYSQKWNCYFQNRIINFCLPHSLKLKCSHSHMNLRILSSTCVPFTLTTVQVPSLALTHTKRITVQFLHSYICERFIYFQDRSANSVAGIYVDRSWECINRSKTNECGNWDWGRAIPRKGIHIGDFPSSARNTKVEPGISLSCICCWEWLDKTSMPSQQLGCLCNNVSGFSGTLKIQLKILFKKTSLLNH